MNKNSFFSKLAFLYIGNIKYIGKEAKDFWYTIADTLETFITFLFFPLFIVFRLFLMIVPVLFILLAFNIQYLSGEELRQMGITNEKFMEAGYYLKRHVEKIKRRIKGEKMEEAGND